MPQKYNILLIDDDELVLRLIKRQFYKHSFINILNTINNTENVFNYLNSYNNIDLIIIDLVMPNNDGLDIIKYICKMKIKVKIIVLTSFTNAKIISKMCNLGVEYYLTKPCSFKKLEETITKSIINKQKNFKSLDCLLDRLGIPSHLKGYTYLKSAIMLFKSNYLIEDIYKMISKEENTLYKNIESAIRYAISIGYERADTKMLEYLFGYTICSTKSNISNYHFIKTICNKWDYSDQIIDKKFV